MPAPDAAATDEDACTRILRLSGSWPCPAPVLAMRSLPREDDRRAVAAVCCCWSATGSGVSGPRTAASHMSLRLAHTRTQLPPAVVAVCPGARGLRAAGPPPSAAPLPPTPPSGCPRPAGASRAPRRAAPAGQRLGMRGRREPVRATAAACAEARQRPRRGGGRAGTHGSLTSEQQRRHRPRRHRRSPPRPHLLEMTISKLFFWRRP